MTKHNYTFHLSEKICPEMEAEHQDDKQLRQHAGTSVLYQASLTPVQSAFKRDFGPSTYLLHPYVH